MARLGVTTLLEPFEEEPELEAAATAAAKVDNKLAPFKLAKFNPVGLAPEFPLTEF